MIPSLTLWVMCCKCMDVNWVDVIVLTSLSSRVIVDWSEGIVQRVLRDGAGNGHQRRAEGLVLVLRGSRRVVGGEWTLISRGWI